MYIEKLVSKHFVNVTSFKNFQKEMYIEKFVSKQFVNVASFKNSPPPQKKRDIHPFETIPKDDTLHW